MLAAAAFRIAWGKPRRAKMRVASAKLLKTAAFSEADLAED